MAKERASRARKPARSRSAAKQAAAVDLIASNKAKTIVYVHGIGNKPIESVLKCQWDTALFGFDLGERSRLAYWVNRDYYPDPVEALCGNRDYTQLEEHPTGRGLNVKRQLDTTSLESEAAAITDEKAEQQALLRIAEQIQSRGGPRLKTRAASVEGQGVTAQLFLFDWITRALTRALLRDVHDFLFVDERRRYMEERLQERLDVGGGPFIVIAHSQGSMIAYDVLARAKRKYDVPLLITIGSPLGLGEVKSRMKDITSQKTLGVPTGVGTWINVADRGDPVAIDADLTDDFAPKGTVRDETVVNPDSPTHPHSGSGYLQTTPVRTAVLATIERALFQRVAPFVIARNLSRRLENARPAKREPVLIQLVDVTSDEILATAAAGRTLDQARDEIVAEILKEAKLKENALELRLERLQRYISADLTRRETEHLAGKVGLAKGQLLIERIWRNERKVALLDKSIETIHVGAARNSYGALGKGVLWAVLDSGIAAAHPHFAAGTLEDQYDCTIRGPLGKPGTAPDGNGHGTHVAGIIAGRHDIGPNPVRSLSGVAPAARVRVYKVLDDEGFGDDAWIIKALDHIAATNEQAGSLRIQGINLSLGGPFDQSSFACGHTPLCVELRRLWRHGVLVVLAAGNEGFTTLMTDEGPFDANIDLSISDPANLEEAIAVGSTHRVRPHTYGISYFSSRGPTADGRQKPDLVAPGERILSCRHDFNKKGTTEDDLDVRMSGTSMAAPHVSGLLAAFLSAKPEFVGQPDKVKRILVENCVDLERERGQQGAGLPNLMKMLMNT
jgi:pimeloyl-ACP methyl ester carboxylesterase